MNERTGFLTYQTSYNRDDNMVYRMQWKGTNIWDITITIDELNDDLIIEKTCGCPAFLKFQKGKDCKHIISALEELNSFGIPFRENELQKETDS